MAALEPQELTHPFWIDRTISLAGGSIKLDFKAWHYIGTVDIVMWGLTPVFAALGYSTKIATDARVRYFMGDWEHVRNWIYMSLVCFVCYDMSLLLCLL